MPLAQIPATSLTTAVRNRGLVALFVSNFFSWAGFFLLIPLVAVHYVDDLHWAAGLIGVMLAVRQFTQQGFAPIFGVICDRTGPKLLICSGQVLRAVGFGSMALVDSVPGVLVAMILAGLGGAVFEAPKSSAMAALTLPEDRQRRYAAMGVVGGLGITLGTQTGALLIRQDFRMVALVSGAVYLGLAIWNAAVLPNIAVSVTPVKAWEGLARTWHDVPFRRFVGIGIGYYFVMAQFGLTFTLAATDIAGSRSAIAWIYLVNTIVTVTLGYLAPRWLERWAKPIDLVIAGTLVSGLGMGIVAFSGSVTMILVAAGVFSLGSVISRPGLDTVTANLADPTARGTYFGVAQLSLAIGGALGYLLGGVAYDFGLANDLEAMPWIGFCLLGIVTSAGYLLYRPALTAIREEPASVSAEGSLAT